MPRRCSCCSHTQLVAIDRAIVGGESYRGIARRFKLGTDAVERHAGAHVSEAISRARDVAAVVHGDTMLRDVTALRQQAAELGKQAETNGDLRTALMAVRELTRITELVARLSLEARTCLNQDIGSHPVWHAVAANIFTALEPFPAAKAAVMATVRAALAVPALIVDSNLEGRERDAD